jgi:hypothetical protein
MTQTVEDALKLVKLALVSIADEADATKSQQLAKEVLAVVEGVTVQEPVGLAGEVIGCFDAAMCEGLQEALAETTDERLKDLIERRLMYALYAAQAATTVKGTQA